MNNKIPESEYTKTNSIYSSMRLIFMKVTKFWIILTSSIVFSIIASAVASSFLSKPIVLPIGALVGIIATVGGIAFGGKAAQSFSEPNAPEVDIMAKSDPNMTIATTSTTTTTDTSTKTQN
jgi:flagellar basal body-associated protein FliL